MRVTACCGVWLAGIVWCLGTAVPAESINLKVDRTSVPMGHSVVLEAIVTGDDGQPAAGRLVLPYVNERRWGSHEYTDAQGRATFLLPLPNPGLAQIEAVVKPGRSQALSQWIWASEKPGDVETVYLAKEFSIEGDVSEAALYVVVDDSAEVFVNGQSFGEAQGWQTTVSPEGVAKALHPGKNVLAVRATNASGPAGLLVRLDATTGKGRVTCQTDASWLGWSTAPTQWPSPTPEGGTPVAVIAAADAALWSPTMSGWPELPDFKSLFVGRPIEKRGSGSNVVQVDVQRRDTPRRTVADRHVGMQWEPWFTPMNAYWQTAQAVPVIGLYDSYDRDVMRQHILWFADLGVDFVMADWSNHIWGKQHWSERPEGTNEIIHATTLFLEELAQMRDEGIPVPKMVIMPGLSNGPPATMTAMNEQLEWLYQNYLNNPRFDGLWQDFDGKPLVVILDCGVVAPKESVPVDESHFTVRWMSTQLQITKHEELGDWSWMDGSLYPIPTYRDGKAEAITVTPAYFAENGWLGPEARGRRGGWTYLESFKAAIEHQPRVVLLHQWNEYAGQPEGQGYGPNHDRYVDSYSVEFSDDLEPVSLTAPGYRGAKGGWGFYYLNLTRALLDVFRGQAPDDTLLALGRPARDSEVSGSKLDVEWSTIGKAPEGFDVSVDGRRVAEGLMGNGCSVELAGVAAGAHVLTVEARGARTRYELSDVRMDVPLAEPRPVKLDVPFIVK